MSQKRTGLALAREARQDFQQQIDPPAINQTAAKAQRPLSPQTLADRQRDVALIACTSAIRAAHAARQALLRRHAPSAQRCAREAAQALSVVLSGGRP
jgi:hypothetical protein